MPLPQQKHAVSIATGFGNIVQFPFHNPVVADLEQVLSWLVPTAAGVDGAVAASPEAVDKHRSYILAEADLKPLTAKVCRLSSELFCITLLS